MPKQVEEPQPCQVWSRLGGPLPGIRLGGALAFEYDVHGSHADEPSEQALRQRAYVLLDEQVQITQPVTWGGARAGWWYVDLVEIHCDDDDVRIRDDYLDVVIGPPDRPYRILDLHEYADALDAGVITPHRAAEGLRAMQAFLEKHLHRRSGDAASWLDFPPACLDPLRSAVIADPEGRAATASPAAPPG